MYVMPAGMNMYVDIDSTLIEWDTPPNGISADMIPITCRDITDHYYVNRHNLNFLIKLAQRGHCIVLWSKAGSDWCESVAKALNITHLVWACMSKPTYYLDDIADPTKWMGDHRFYDFDGKKHYNYDSIAEKEKK